MISSRAVLQSYLEGLLHVSGSRAATLFVPPAEYGGGLLLRVGAKEGLPELADLSSARRTCEELEPKAQAFPGESETRILQFASEDDCGLLLRIPAKQDSAFDPSEQRRRRSTDQAGFPGDGVLWVGLTLDQRPPEAKVGEAQDVSLSFAGDAERGMWPWLLAVGGTLVWHEQRVSELLDDGVTGLPGRLQFQDILGRALLRAREKSAPLTLLLVNPDDFDSVNLRFGRSVGDRTLGDLGHVLGTMLRSTDAVARYGAAVFAAILPDTVVADGEEVAEKIRRQVAETAPLSELELGCSVGVACIDPSERPDALPNDLIRDASRALNAARMAGGNQVSVWRPEESSREGATESADHLSDIFTGDPVKDYRNMLLLWGSIRVVAGSGDVQTLAAEALSHVMQALSPLRAAIMVAEGESAEGESEAALGLLHGVRNGPGRSLVEIAESELMPAERSLARRVEASKTSLIEVDSEHEKWAGFPMVAGDRCLGSLILAFDESSKPFDSSDAFFVEALASQLGVALDRARLSALDSARQEEEKRRLEAEVSQLRDALDESQLVYRSAEMEELLSTLRRVAPTDATVLITGESGTGKELLARTLHSLSPRSRKTMVVVDCGSIPPTLVESELFGHERGAYTGAAQRRTGRLAEANGSTLFLDEIGELPLEVQAKLLRFVQERQFTPVGGNRPQEVDVRIVAATNRDLLSEVHGGRFREDLYYRLKVVSVDAPALRHRPDDIQFLARHFLQRSALMYGKPVRALSPEAEALLLRYDWPGNVRELQNRMMQAVILCEGTELGPEDLRLGPTERSTVGQRAPASAAWTAGRPDVNDDSAGDPPAELESTNDPWQDLSSELARHVEGALATGGRILPPLGRWLAEDLILAADVFCRGNARKGAEMLQIPETTLRRRLQKAKDQKLAGLAARSEDWPGVLTILERIVAAPEAAASFERSQALLLQEVARRVGDSKKRGAALLGVTTPTYQRRVESMPLPESV